MLEEKNIATPSLQFWSHLSLPENCILRPEVIQFPDVFGAFWSRNTTDSDAPKENAKKDLSNASKIIEIGWEFAKLQYFEILGILEIWNIEIQYYWSKIFKKSSNFQVL